MFKVARPAKATSRREVRQWGVIRTIKARVEKTWDAGTGEQDDER